MTTSSQLASALIAVFEGERLRAYRDSGGVLTIGIGHTGPDVTEGMTITHEQAVTLFQKDKMDILSLLAGRPPTEVAALASFGFNCGRGALQKVLAGTDTIDNPRHRTDRSGSVLPGLVTRRRLEMALMGLTK